MLERFSRKTDRFLFKTRSVDRDAETDNIRVGAVWRAIQLSLQAADAERAGLLKRMDSAMAGALVSLGNGTDEYLTRDALDNRRLGEREAEIRNGERRLKQLAHTIAQFEALKTALQLKFPNFSASP
jgi:hypothetical protein